MLYVRAGSYRAGRPAHGTAGSCRRRFSARGGYPLSAEPRAQGLCAVRQRPVCGYRSCLCSKAPGKREGLPRTVPQEPSTMAKASSLRHPWEGRTGKDMPQAKTARPTRCPENACQAHFSSPERPWRRYRHCPAKDVPAGRPYHPEASAQFLFCRNGAPSKANPRTARLLSRQPGKSAGQCPVHNPSFRQPAAGLPHEPRIPAQTQALPCQKAQPVDCFPEKGVSERPQIFSRQKRPATRQAPVLHLTLSKPCSQELMSPCAQFRLLWQAGFHQQ